MPCLNIPCCRIVTIAAPMILEEALSYASTLISLAYAGRLGARALSVFALSHSLTNITGEAPERQMVLGTSRETHRAALPWSQHA